MSKIMERKGFELFAVGTSDRLHGLYKAELDELVSKPSESHELIVDFDKSSYNEDQVKQLAEKICHKAE